MSFTDGKPRTATEEECRATWGGLAPGETFRCYLCGHKFVPGDAWRWQHGASQCFVDYEGIRRGVRNFKVCAKCDSPDVLERWVERHREFYGDPKWWAFR